MNDTLVSSISVYISNSIFTVFLYGFIARSTDPRKGKGVIFALLHCRYFDYLSPVTLITEALIRRWKLIRNDCSRDNSSNTLNDNSRLVNLRVLFSPSKKF